MIQMIAYGDAGKYQYPCNEHARSIDTVCDPTDNIQESEPVTINPYYPHSYYTHAGVPRVHFVLHPGLSKCYRL